MLPFRTDDHQFRPETSFESVCQLHDFDEELRNLVFRKIQQIEIGIRSQFNEYFCMQTQTSFWYLDSKLFGRVNTTYAETVTKVRRSFLDSQEAFAVHYRNRYYNEFCSFYSLMPPSWMAMELMTFGNMLSLLNSVDDETIKELKLDRFTRRNIGPDKYKKLTNWLICLRDVRNHCAHHSRLMNRNFPAPDGIKKYLSKSIGLVEIPDTGGKQVQVNRIYTALAVMAVLGKKLGHAPMGPELVEIFEKYPASISNFPSMGFPENWQEEALFF